MRGMRVRRMVVSDGCSGMMESESWELYARCEWRKVVVQTQHSTQQKNGIHVKNARSNQLKLKTCYIQTDRQTQTNIHTLYVLPIRSEVKIKNACIVLRELRFPLELLCHRVYVDGVVLCTYCERVSVGGELETGDPLQTDTWTDRDTDR